jgi:hypothetical protein
MGLILSPGAKTQAKSEILFHGQMRIKCRSLEYHGYISLIGRHIIHNPAADPDFP